MNLQNIKTNLKSIFGILGGVMLFYFICAIWTIALCGYGIYLVKKYNEKNTKLLKQLNTLQIFGIILICLGVIPFIDVLVRGIFFNIGGNVGQFIVDETRELI